MKSIKWVAFCFVCLLFSASTSLAGVDPIQAPIVEPEGTRLSTIAAVSSLPGVVTLGQGPMTAFQCTTHDVTAFVRQALSPFNPLSGETVTFDVLAGPNAGVTGIGHTDANGNAVFTYTGAPLSGIDQIQASFVDAGQTQVSNILTVPWGPSPNDRNLNGLPDECEQGGLGDCNLNGVPDLCDLIPELQFDAGTPNPVGAVPLVVIAAELNGLAGLDLVAAHSGQTNISVLLNQGDGTFSPAVNYATDKESFSVAAADLDGDGDLDLAAATKNDTVSVLLNNGDGTFVSLGDFVTLGDRPTSIAAGDLDGLNGPDVVVANRNADVNGDFTVSLLLNNGDGTLAAPVSLVVQDTPRHVVMEDLDGANGLDLAVANKQSDTVSVVLNNGDGTFAPAVHVPAGNGPVAIAVGDLDGDFDPDMAVVDTGSDSVVFLRNNGNGTFVTGGGFAVGVGPTSVAAEDLDGDGDLDLAIANNGTLALPGTTFSVLLNLGDGTMAPPKTFPTGASPFWLIAADLDQVAAPDLAIAQDLAAGIVTVHLGQVVLFSQDCNANAIPDECEIDMNSPAPGGPFFCSANCDTDCNGNGIPDACDPESGDVALFLTTLLADNPDPTAVCLLDRTGDGQVDGNDIQPFVNALLGL